MKYILVLWLCSSVPGNECKLLQTSQYLFKDAYDPGIDLSFEQYQSEMEAKTLEELIKETSTDHEFYTLDAFMKRYG